MSKGSAFLVKTYLHVLTCEHAHTHSLSLSRIMCKLGSFYLRVWVCYLSIPSLSLPIYLSLFLCSYLFYRFVSLLLYILGLCRYINYYYIYKASVSQYYFILFCACACLYFLVYYLTIWVVFLQFPFLDLLKISSFLSDTLSLSLSLSLSLFLFFVLSFLCPSSILDAI